MTKRANHPHRVNARRKTALKNLQKRGLPSVYAYRKQLIQQEEAVLIARIRTHEMQHIQLELNAR